MTACDYMQRLSKYKVSLILTCLSSHFSTLAILPTSNTFDHDHIVPSHSSMFPGLAAPPTAGAPDAEAAPAPAEDGISLIDLSEKLDKSACYARNENAGYPWGNLFIGDSRLGMKSDADEQLIIHLSFQEFVRVCEEVVPMLLFRPQPLISFNINNVIFFTSI